MNKLQKDLQDLDKRFTKGGRDFGKLALEKTKCKDLANLFSGPTAVALSKDAISSAKILTKFSKENNNFNSIATHLEEVIKLRKIEAKIKTIEIMNITLFFLMKMNKKNKPNKNVANAILSPLIYVTKPDKLI